MALISCQNILLAYGGHPLLEDATLHIERSERIGLLGRNGAGKSSLLKIVAGLTPPDDGERIVMAGTRTAYLPQTIPDGIDGSVGELVREQLPHGYTADHPAERLCSLLNLDPEDDFSILSGGQKRRALLGCALASEPNLLILDEPTNHLDLDSIQWLENFLLRFSGSLLFVTHDRAFLQRLSTRIIELDRGQLSSWNCDYPTFLRRKEALINAEIQQWSQFDKKLAQEETWIRQGIKARRTRNEGRVRALEQLRVERTRRREQDGTVNINISTADRSGRKVITAKDVSFAYDEPIVSSLDTTIMRGDRIGIIGPNGCGKTTLLNILLGKLAPGKGTVEHGTNLEIVYFDQHREQLMEDRDVLYNVSDGNEFVQVDGSRRHAIGYLKDFLFSPDRIRQPVSSLSGGERNRLLLARLFTRPSNVLVLDEPTNDLDLETLEMLEARLLDYPGTVLLVSHDRSFLDNLCTSCFVFEGKGVIKEYVGGYSDWQRVVQRRDTPAAKASPKKATPSQSQAPSHQQKLTNKEREELKKLPGRIEQLEAELEELQQHMADPEFFKGPADEVKSVSRRIAELPGAIEQAYTRWTELEQRPS